MKQPIEPTKEDCCNSGCNPCVFDVYEQQLKLYKKYLETGELSGDKSENAISQLEYTNFILVKKVNLCEAHILLLFKRLEDKENNSKVWWSPGTHFLVKYISEETPCTRAYTPLKHSDQSNTNCDFSVIIKVYENGLVSKYLNDLRLGDYTLWRGPYGSYEVVPNKYNRIIMIAQGTGIAPFISIIENIINNDDDMTKITLYYCTKSIDTILLRDELYLFQEYWNFSYKIFISNLGENSKHKYKEPIVNHKLKQEDLCSLKPFSSNDQFLLCGTSQFMMDMKQWLTNEDNSLQNIILF
ncbi:NADH-cytochrome b5 reductase-like [Pectinophora gossypiella]|uniref:NADH-cytochrome b5 reductase-like n=1 Tax=Pectinophora gossypiella TaxID=13191 RepID=UPI00214EF178|nr:NADH-cytochrome b5 reductase-like [Pectinophora gossypiella]